MQEFSTYKKNKIAHYHKDNGLHMINTIRKFSITHKELYKIIETSRIFNYWVKNGVLYKRCSGCKAFIVADEEHFYKRKWTEYLQSTCKYCMKLLAKAYKIINKEKVYASSKAYLKEYYQKNKTEILARGKIYYRENRKRILSRKRFSYKTNKQRDIKKFLQSITNARHVKDKLYTRTIELRARNVRRRNLKLTNTRSNEAISWGGNVTSMNNKLQHKANHKHEDVWSRVWI